MRVPVIRVLGLTLGMIVACSTFVSAQTRAEADEVMAAFVSRFPQFVEWPPALLEGRNALELCVAEPGRFPLALERLLEGQELHGLPLALRSVERSRALDGCHVLYLSSSTEQRDALLRDAAERPILTVGTETDFLEDGGIILLRVVDRRIRFEVNSAAAARAGLRLSSQLLNLAVAVHGGPL